MVRVEVHVAVAVAVAVKWTDVKATSRSRSTSTSTSTPAARRFRGIAALVEGLTHREKIEAIELGAEISLETGAWLSPLVMDTHAFEELERLEARLALDILREGVLL